jgi:hypothetical protein
MRGLLAHFKSVSEVQKEASSDLTVVTSFGRDTVENRVLIHVPVAKPDGAPLAKMAAGFFVAGTTTPPLKIAVDPNSIPTNYAGFALKIRPVNSSTDWISEDTVPVTRSPDGKILSFQIPSPPAPNQINSPTVVLVDLRLKPNLFDEPINLLAKLDSSERMVMFFPLADQEKPVVAAVKVTYKGGTPDANALVIGTAPNVTAQNLLSAYPGLEASIKNGTATLTLSSTTNTALKVTRSLEMDPANWRLKLTGLVSTDLPAGVYDTAKLTYKSPSGDADIPVLIPPTGTGASQQKGVEIVWQ